MQLIQFIVIIVQLHNVAYSLRCSIVPADVQQKFYISRYCQRSNGTIISEKKTETAENCAAFARLNKALAFNYSPNGMRQLTNDFDDKSKVSNTTTSNHTNYIEDEEEEEDRTNCEILECPEYSNFSTVVNDSRYDYYSLYTNPAPNENATCVVGIGMVNVHETPENYSSAERRCRSNGGALVHVLSAQRTHAMSQLFNEYKNASRHHFAFIGLQEMYSKNNFTTSSNESMSCFRYRAWAPGHPRKFKNSSCVALTRDNSWILMDCKNRLPFICEIFTSRPHLMATRKKKCPKTHPTQIKMPPTEIEFL